MGVRSKKTQRTKVVSIIGKTKRQEYKAKGSKHNMMTGLLNTKMPLTQSYGRMGIASKAGMSEAEKKRVVKEIPEDKLMQLPRIKEQGPSKPKHVSDLEHGFIDNLVTKHGLNFKAMSWDMKLNPFQLTAKQIRKRVLNVIKTEKRLFPEAYKEAFGDENDIDEVESGDEW